MVSPAVARAVRTQRAAVGETGIVVVIFDSDDDDPESIEEEVRERISRAAASTIVVAAVREYEAWFLAGIDSLRSHASITSDAAFPGDPELPRDAKGRLADLMTEPYKETLHQARFTSLLDLDAAAQRSPSLKRLIAQVETALRVASGPGPQ